MSFIFRCVLRVYVLFCAYIFFFFILLQFYNEISSNSIHPDWIIADIAVGICGISTTFRMERVKVCQQWPIKLSTMVNRLALASMDWQNVMQMF